MDKESLQKQLSDTIGRNFNLVFNQVSMYNVYHKSVLGSLERAFESFQNGFAILPTIALSLNQEQVFIEDEALDTRINTSRLTNHFKKSDIQSLAFESGMTLADLTQFLEILTDLNKYPNATSMKKAMKGKGLGKILINYFVYKKIKTDETVVKSSQATGDGTGGSGDANSGAPSTDDILSIMAADILSEEAQKNISVQNLMQGPAEFSQMLIQEDLAAAGKTENGSVQPGTALVQSLNRFQADVDEVLANRTDVNISDLAENIFNLKRRLIQGIEAQKAQGVVYLDQKIIDREVDEVADNVLIRLITEEYDQGKVSVKRLAQIVLRMTTDTVELQRIIPKLKRTLLDAGMSMADYLQFVQELKDELQSDELTQVLEHSAEAIGLDGEDLIQEIVRNPQEAAELIYLAAEIRKSGRDDGILSDLLVDYVERAGTELTMDALESDDSVDSGKVNSIFSRIRTELVDKLKHKEIGNDVLERMEARLVERLDESIRHLKSSMVFKQVQSGDSRPPTKADMLKLLQSQSKDENELREIVLQVKEALAERGVQENLFEELYDEIMAKPVKKEKPKTKLTPPGSLNRGSTLFVLEKEILRANRYDTPFSILSFMVIKAVPIESAKHGRITPDDIITGFVRALTDIVRETDLVGMISAKMVVVIQPMTPGENAKIALDRITQALRSSDFVVNDIPFDINFAATVTPFDAERTVDLKTFVSVAQTDLKNLASRVSNIQSMI
jgi:GGDEF domain-containing protein